MTLHSAEASGSGRLSPVVARAIGLVGSTVTDFPDDTTAPDQNSLADVAPDGFWDVGVQIIAKVIFQSPQFIYRLEPTRLGYNRCGLCLWTS